MKSYTADYTLKLLPVLEAYTDQPNNRHLHINGTYLRYNFLKNSDFVYM